MRNAFIDTVLEAFDSRDDIFVVSGDAGLGVFDEFKEQHPDRFLNLGVAEQNTIGFAAGLGLVGFKVVAYNIIPFVLYRCYEQVRNDVCYQEVPLVLVGIGSGLTYSPQGMTHYSVEDLGLAQTLPNLTVISPADPMEARAAARFALGSENPTYIRLAKKGEPDIHASPDLDITGPLVVQEGEDVAILFHGSVSIEALKARALLEQEGLRPMLISVPTVQPMDADRLFGRLAGMRHVVTVEEHFVNCGLGSIVARECVAREATFKLHTLGVSYGFVHDIRDQDGMRDMFQISASRIAGYVGKLGR